MWCPGDFRRHHSVKKVQEDREAEIYTQEYVDRVNAEHSLVKFGKYVKEY